MNYDAGYSLNALSFLYLLLPLCLESLKNITILSRLPVLLVLLLQQVSFISFVAGVIPCNMCARYNYSGRTSSAGCFALPLPPRLHCRPFFFFIIFCPNITGRDIFLQFCFETFF